MHEHGHLEFESLLWFAGWLIAIGVLFVVALRVPLQTRLSRFSAWVYSGGVILAFVMVAVFAGLAQSLHDQHFDLTRERVFTPSEQALEVVDRLTRPVKLTYFYQGQDPNGKRTRDVVEVMGRRNPHATGADRRSGQGADPGQTAWGQCLQCGRAGSGRTPNP